MKIENPGVGRPLLGPAKNLYEETSHTFLPGTNCQVFVSSEAQELYIGLNFI